MKTPILSAAIVACLLSTSIATAQEKPASAKQAMGMDMDKHMPHMQENMKKMQQQMDKVSATSDPKERQKLMQEHMQAMQENMKTMRGMGGPMMTGSGQGGGTPKNHSVRQRTDENKVCLHTDIFASPNQPSQRKLTPWMHHQRQPWSSRLPSSPCCCCFSAAE